MGTRRRVSDHLFGNCWTAQLIENGAVEHTLDPGHWHHRCRGAVTQGNGTLVKCTCSCHAEHQICLDCGEPHQELGENLRCLDRSACAAHITRRLEANEIAQQVRAAYAGAATKEADERVREGRSGRCEHCGEPTRGGKFLPGHDAKLKGSLIKAANDGDEDAKAELVARRWKAFDGIAPMSEAEVRARTEARWATQP